MALTYNEKIAVAKLRAEGLSAYAIYQKLGIPKDRIYRALKDDEELRSLVEDFAKDCEDNKKLPQRTRKRLSKIYIDKRRRAFDTLWGE